MYVYRINRQNRTISVRKRFQEITIQKVGRRGPTGPSGSGIPDGGTTGQVLTKVTNTDFDADWQDISGVSVASVNGLTGVVLLDQDDIGDGITYKQYSSTEKTKLAGIEAGADVTDPTNVSAAGAFMKASDDTDDINVGITNKFATSAEKTKVGLITVTQAVDLDAVEANADNVPGIKTKTDFITVTQAVDLDTMESDISSKQPLDSDLTSIAALDSSTSGAIASDGAGWIKKTYAQLKTALGLVKGDVGLGNVDNTSDANKPVSTAQQTALDLKQSLSAKDQANGYVGLDGSSKINPSQLPALAITETSVVASQVAMLALTAQIGDVAVRTDQNKSYILTAEPASTLGNWQELLTPTDSVSSVFGRTGVVTAQNGDYTASQVTNVPGGSIGAVTVQAAIDELDSEKQPVDSDLTTIAGLSPSNDDVIQRKAGAWANRTMAQVKTDLVLTKTDVGLANVDNTSDATKNAASVTLTNKTLTAPVINSPTGIVKGDVGLGNVDNTSDATKNSATATLTNKRITIRASTEVSSATPTINTDNVNFHSITALAVNITSMTTNLSGTPTEDQTLWIAITGTAARTIAWGASFEASTVALPTTTVSTDRLDIGFVWNTVSSKWRCVAVA